MRAGQNLKDAVKLLTASKVALLIAPSEVGKCGKCVCFLLDSESLKLYDTSLCRFEFSRGASRMRQVLFEAKLVAVARLNVSVAQQ